MRVRQALLCWPLELYFVFSFEAESHCVVQGGIGFPSPGNSCVRQPCTRWLPTLTLDLGLAGLALLSMTQQKAEALSLKRLSLGLGKPSSTAAHSDFGALLGTSCYTEEGCRLDQQLPNGMV